MFKKCQIVLRPTSHKARNGQQPVSAYSKPATKSGLILPTSLRHLNHFLEMGHQAYHVDILSSDEEVERGDWLYMDNNIHLHEGVQKGLALPDVITHRNEDGDLVCSDARTFSKIIASTDPSLNLPEISPEYLKLFCKTQPKEVLVEFVYDIESSPQLAFSGPVVKNNTIVIKNLERTYTTSEVLDIIRSVQTDCAHFF